MGQERVEGCIFEDTPKECSSITPNGKCLGLGKIQCLFNHIRLIIVKDAKAELLDLLNKEINSPRRYKHLSGLAGRVQPTSISNEK